MNITTNMKRETPTSQKMDTIRLKKQLMEELKLHPTTPKLKLLPIKVNGRQLDKLQITRLKITKVRLQIIKVINTIKLREELLIMEPELVHMEDRPEETQPFSMTNQELLQKMFMKAKWFLRLRDKRD